MTEQYELPSWSVYVMFATVTILVGALLGLLLVFCIDCVLPYMMGSGVKQSESTPHGVREIYALLLLGDGEDPKHCIVKI